MNELKLNETPLRTSRNFGINNIKLTDVEIPINPKKFETLEVQLKNSIIEESNENVTLKYGNGTLLEKNIARNANSKIKITITEKKEEIKLVYNFDDENLNLINQIEIQAFEDANIFIEYKSNTNKKCFHNGIINVIANANTNINITIFNLLNNLSDNFESIQNKIYENASVNYTIIDIGAKNSISNYFSDIVGENASDDLKTIYLGIGNQLKDINYIAELRGEKTNIDIDVQGALKDSSIKHFKGTIDFKKGCKKAKGNENEYCMLLSDKAKSLALPMLLCTEEDVEGNHSTASGKIDSKELFYIMSRGIKYKDAIKLIVKAKFNKILQRINDEKTRNEIIEEIDRRLD